jgi:hypothetical protein
MRRHHVIHMPLAVQLWLTWPFLAWGALIVLCYAVGYTLLGLVNEPICLFNVVNYMACQFKYGIFLTMVMPVGCIVVLAAPSFSQGQQHNTCTWHQPTYLLYPLRHHHASSTLLLCIQKAVQSTSASQADGFRQTLFNMSMGMETNYRVCVCVCGTLSPSSAGCSWSMLLFTAVFM